VLKNKSLGERVNGDGEGVNMVYEKRIMKPVEIVLKRGEEV
jgi:hypothetical protein